MLYLFVYFPCNFSSGLNGMITPQDLYGEAAEAVEHVDGADNKRGFNSHDVGTGQPNQAGHTPDLPLRYYRQYINNCLKPLTCAWKLQRKYF